MALTLPARGGREKIPAWGHQSLVLIVQLSDQLAHILPCFSITNTLGHARWGSDGGVSSTHDISHIPHRPPRPVFRGVCDDQVIDVCIPHVCVSLSCVCETRIRAAWRVGYIGMADPCVLLSYLPHPDTSSGPATAAESFACEGRAELLDHIRSLIHTHIVRCHVTHLSDASGECVHAGGVA